MARKYSRDKGKSGSTKPLKKALPTWIRYKAKEVELLVTKLAKEGKGASMIGLALRDSYGIPDVKKVTGKSITAILKEKEAAGAIPEDIAFLIKRVVQLKKHLELNHKDMTAKRGLQLTESKVKALEKYYKRTGALPKTFKYTTANAAMLLR